MSSMAGKQARQSKNDLKRCLNDNSHQDDNTFDSFKQFVNNVLVSPSTPSPLSKKRRTQKETVASTYERLFQISEKGVEENTANWEHQVQSRYDRVTKIRSDEGSLPLSFCYTSNQGENPPDTAYMPVEIHPSDEAVPNSLKNVWLSLKSEYNLLLLAVYQTGVSLSKKIRFDTEEGIWIRQSATLDTDVDDLERYGDMQSADKTILDILSSDLDTTAPLSELNTYKHYSSTLPELWVTAFLFNMTNGTARKAIDVTMSILTTLLDAFPCPSPKISVLHCTSPTSGRSLSIVDGSSSFRSSKSRSSHRKGNLSVLESNCNQTQDEHPISKRLQESSQDTAESTLSSPPSCNPDAHYVDLCLFLKDSVVSGGNYIFLIHSHGKTLPKAQGKFLTEMIHVLQGQSIVYGLLFTKDEVTLYSAKRSQLSINILSKSYPFRYFVTGKFRASQFQLLFMDILTCLFHALTFPDV